MWQSISTAPEGVMVMTKIEDALGVRNEQAMVYSNGMWFADETYVYYQPTHWRPLTELERLKMKNEAERKAIDALERSRRVLGD